MKKERGHADIHRSKNYCGDKEIVLSPHFKPCTPRTAQAVMYAKLDRSSIESRLEIETGKQMSHSEIITTKFMQPRNNVNQ